MTSRMLDAMGVRHFVVVEKPEARAYRRGLPPSAEVLVLDPAFQRDYDTCDDLGDSKSRGPGAARNFAWEHSLSLGARWHWVMDDNIWRFYRLLDNLYRVCLSPAFWWAQEEWADRYSNLAMAGPQYFMFAPRKAALPAVVLNTRIYSCNLIRNDLPLRWRGRYNEDTDLSLRILKAGLVTAQFNAFLQHKLPTQTVPGGCNADFYQREGTGPKSEMLWQLHPDCTRVVVKWGRVHHHVDYRPFKGNRLRLRPGVRLEDLPETDEFGMELVPRRPLPSSSGRGGHGARGKAKA